MMTLKQLLDTLPERGAFRPLEVIGDTDIKIAGVNSPDLAWSWDLVFYTRERLGDARYGTDAKCIIASEPIDYPGKTVLFTPEPKLLFAYLAQEFIERPNGKHDRRIAYDTWLDRSVFIDHHTQLLGRNVTIEAGAVIQHATIGDNVWIGPNVVIGGQGFGHVTDPATGRVVKFPQVGRVIIGDNVEICAQSAIARGALDDTVIGDDVRMDQFVHIAHGCKIGQGTLLMAHAMIAGSVTIGRYCWIAPGTNVINKATIGDFAMTGVGATVIGDVEPNALVVGVPARKIRDRFAPDDPMLRL